MLQDGKSRFHTRLDTKLARIDVTPNLIVSVPVSISAYYSPS
jgi:hypothetical protein